MTTDDQEIDAGGKSATVQPGVQRRQSPRAWLARHGVFDTTKALVVLRQASIRDVFNGFEPIGQDRRAAGSVPPREDEQAVREARQPLLEQRLDHEGEKADNEVSQVIGHPLLAQIVACADPDGALSTMGQLAERHPDAHRWGQQLGADADYTRRLLSVIGFSQGLVQVLLRDPVAVHQLRTVPFTVLMQGWNREELLQIVKGQLQDNPAQPGVLQRAYHRLLLCAAADDLSAAGWGLSVQVVGQRLSVLAQVMLDVAVDLAAAQPSLVGRIHDEHARLAVIALGKCGAQELNYVSDVDVIFVAAHSFPPGQTEVQASEQPSMATAQAWAGAVMEICAQSTPYGRLWEVDAALRPEGKAGPLVRSVPSHLAYYQRWAHTWEFQALLKARPAAGDVSLGQRYCEALAPLVWQASSRQGFVADVQHMRQRVHNSLEGELKGGQQIKLGKGGLRDVEFAVQLLQLVHGASDEQLRVADTVQGLQRLAAGGYVGRDDSRMLIQAYEFLRALEHRLQLRRLTRTELLPTDSAALAIVGRSMGMSGDAAQALVHHHHHFSQHVRRLHEKLFYRPLLSAVAALPPGQGTLSAQAAVARLEALGYGDPASALAHLQALSNGVSRRAAIQRTLLPVLLGWFAQGPDCDAGLLAFRQVSEALGSSSWYLRALRDEGALAFRLALLLSSSRYCTDLLLRNPEALTLFGQDDQLQQVTDHQVPQQMEQTVRRYWDSEFDSEERGSQRQATDAVHAVRALRRDQLLRLAARQVLIWQGELPADGCNSTQKDRGDPGSPARLQTPTQGVGLSALSDATLQAALQVALRTVGAQWKGPWASGGQLPMRLAVIAMGSLGGQEMGFASDVDVMYVVEPVPLESVLVEPGMVQPSPQQEPKAAEAALHAGMQVAHQLQLMLGAPGADPSLQVDPNLRPEGRQGPLVRTLDSYRVYYQRWAQVWEHQALLRVRCVAGNSHVGEEFISLINPLRYPCQGVNLTQIREIRRVKARVDSQRLPHDVDRHRHLKLGPGGLADVQWCVQLLQLRHAYQFPELRTPGTLPALTAATTQGLLTAEQGKRLTQAWCLLTHLRDGVTVLTGRGSDVLPGDGSTLTALARLLGYRLGTGSELMQEYRRCTRRAHQVVEEVFW